MKKKSKRRYADGGNVTPASTSPTSAFAQPSQVTPSPSNIFASPNYSGGAAGGAGDNAGTNGPLVTINTNGGAPATFRKGGKVKSSFKGDGIAKKGKTKGRFV